MPRFFRSLFGQVVLALVAGVVIGLVWPQFAASLKPLGDGFIKLIKMIIPVLVFCVVVHGIAGAGDLKRVGRVGVKALIYFELLTTVALAIGLAFGYLFHFTESLVRHALGELRASHEHLREAVRGADAAEFLFGTEVVLAELAHRAKVQTSRQAERDKQNRQIGMTDVTAWYRQIAVRIHAKSSEGNDGHALRLLRIPATYVAG